MSRAVWWGLAACAVVAMLMARDPLCLIFAPDDMAHDWYGWLTNQSSHLILGALLTLVASVIGLLVLGEYPYRVEIGVMVLLLILTFETGVQPLNGWDTLNDVLFMAYGAIGALLVCREVEAGGVELFFNPTVALALSGLAVGHLVGGCLARV